MNTKVFFSSSFFLLVFCSLSIIALDLTVRNKLILDAQIMRFREYPQDETSRVYQHYKNMHIHQTLDFVLSQKQKYSHFDSYLELSVEEVFELLGTFIDPSDPDVDIGNAIHNYQTAEHCRQLLPDVDWFHLVGLIHDIGKIIYLFGEPTWAVTGDTFPVGYPFSKKCIYYNLFKDNPDLGKGSIYSHHCGFDNVHFSWGHDEYLYHVLANNNTSLPAEALYTIRYHSFYPFHQEHAYLELANEKDLNMLGYLKLFNQCDLYSKHDDVIDYNDIKDYYSQLIRKYLPEKLRFFKPVTFKTIRQ